MTDVPAEKPSIARCYCPGCEPLADVIAEILEVRWCDDHSPARGGADDALASARGVALGTVEAGGDDNRRWCALIHGDRDAEAPGTSQ